MSLRWPALACAALVACASRVAPRPAPPIERAAHTTVAVPSRAIVQVRPWTEGPRWCLQVEEHDGVVRRLRGGVREEIRDGVTHRAEVRFVAEPDWVTHDDAGWHFFSRSNRWRSRDFLGDPEQVQRAPHAVIGRGVGRAVTIFNGAIEEMSVPGTVIDAAFVDENVGFALVEPGVALHTVDGGQSWTHLPADDVLGLVLASAEGVFALGKQHLWRTEGTTLVPAQHPFITPSECSDEPQTPPAVPPITPRVDWDDDAHTAVVLDARGTRYDLVRDRVVPASEPPCPEPERVPGSARIAVCLEEHERLSVHVRNDLGAWSRLGTMRRCGQRCVASHDGTRVACTGRCDIGGECDGLTTTCELTEGGRAIERRYGDDARTFTPVGYDGDALLMVDHREHLGHAEFVRGDDPPQRLCPHLPARGYTRLVNDAADPFLGPNGMLEFEGPTSGQEQGRTVFVVRPGRECLRRTEAPFNAPTPRLRGEEGAWEMTCVPEGRSLRFHDDALWTREGGDRPWQRLALTLPEVEPAWLHAQLRRGRVECSDVGLWISGGDVAVLGWGRVASTRRVSIGADEAPGDFDPRFNVEWSCRVEPEPRPLPAAPGTPDGDGARGGRSNVVRSGTRLWFRVSSRSPDGLPAFTWQAVSSRGIAPEMLPSGWFSRPERNTALLGIPTEHNTFTIWRVSATAPAVRLGDFERVYEESVPVRTATAGGVTALLWESENLAPGRMLATLLRVEGSRVQRFPVMYTQYSRDALVAYVLRGEAGVARLREDGSLVGGAPGAAPRVLAHAGALGACGPTAEGAVSGARIVTSDTDSFPRPVLLDFAFEGDRLCLRGSADPLQGARIESGALILTQGAGDHVERWTCRPPTSHR